MARGTNTKPDLKRIGVFGANSRIGRPMSVWVTEHSPGTELRLIVRSENHRESLEADFPNAEVVIADYYDLPSLEKAVDGCNGLFVVTPDFLDEERAMTNFIYACRTQTGIHHIVRLVADPNGMKMDRVPQALKKYGGGTAMQHLRAREVLDKSGLPITYINPSAYFMQNFLTPAFSGTLQAMRTLVVPRDRRMAHIDANDIGACAAALLVSENQRHIGQTYYLNNNHDIMYFEDVADMMSDVFGEKIKFDGTDETFLKIAGPAINAQFGRPDGAEYYLHYFQFEQDNETVWRKSDIVEYLTGRKPKKLRDFLTENKNAILGIE